jgi:hypothetical protein
MSNESIGPLTKAQLAISMYPGTCKEAALAELLSNLQAWAQFNGIDWDGVVARAEEALLDLKAA